jgi:hypothetical protein
MEGRQEDTAGRTGHKRFDALTHLRGGLIRKREAKNAKVLALGFLENSRDSRGKNLRLSRAWTS